MRLSFLGAAGEVTGSATLLDTGAARVLVDFGLHQGRPETERRNASRELLALLKGRPPDAVVLTHAHLDHCGRLPLLERWGVAATVHCSPATVDLTGLVLRDAAAIQQSDAARANRRRRPGQPEIEPLYSIQEAEQALRRLMPLDFGEWREIAAGVFCRLSRNAHILGSASVELRVAAGGGERTIVFSGDVGSAGVPLARDPVPPEHADVLLLESTYGDRDHRPPEATYAEFADIVASALAERGKILIPAFAIGRTQTILFLLGQLARERTLPKFPVYVDSPMAIDATTIHARWLDELLDPSQRRELVRRARTSPPPYTMHAVRSSDESRALNGRAGPAVIIAGSGMCTGGRIVHHLRHNLAKPETHVLLVGYQAEGTLGRRLVDRASHVEVLGETVPVRARVHTLNGLSAHAGQSGLLWWAGALGASRPRTFLNHGEDRPRRSLAEAMRQRLGLECTLPEHLQSFEI